MLDLAIIGAGPAGMSAAVYAARYLIDFKIYGQIPGGLIAEAHKIENYPGFAAVSGESLIKDFLKHLDHLGVQLQNEQVRGIRTQDGHFKIAFDGQEIAAKKVLLAIGTQRTKLAIPGESEFLGKGVSFCATCDAFFFRNKRVAVIGGSDSAVTAALYLADIASEVFLIYRGKELRAEPAWVKKAEENEKIRIITETNVTEIRGTRLVEEIILDKKHEDQNGLKINGVFIEIGTTPNVAILEPLGVATDEKGFIIVDDAQKTNIDGVWAAGDITTGSNKLRQIVTAAAEGAVAVHDIYQSLKKER